VQADIEKAVSYPKVSHDTKQPYKKGLANCQSSAVDLLVHVVLPDSRLAQIFAHSGEGKGVSNRE
jgi:hypothetical protein